jgi:hypothetical protein
MNIQIRIKNVYGRELYCVVDENQGNALRALTGTTALSKYHIKALKELGHTFTAEVPTL